MNFEARAACQTVTKTSTPEYLVGLATELAHLRHSLCCQMKNNPEQIAEERQENLPGGESCCLMNLFLLKDCVDVQNEGTVTWVVD